jgi:hypothetical protein
MLLRPTRCEAPLDSMAAMFLAASFFSATFKYFITVGTVLLLQSLALIFKIDEIDNNPI